MVIFSFSHDLIFCLFKKKIFLLSGAHCALGGGGGDFKICLKGIRRKKKKKGKKEGKIKKKRECNNF